MKASLNDLNSLPQWLYVAPLILVGLLAVCWLAFFAMSASSSPALGSLIGLMIGLVVLLCVCGGFFAVVGVLPD